MRSMATLEPGAAAGVDRRAAAPDAATLLSLKFCGLQFASPIVLLSGCVGFGEEYTRIEGFSNRDAGAVVLKGTTGDRKSTRLNSSHLVISYAVFCLKK